jgi:8-oxo-dGTP diphosphatase
MQPCDILPVMRDVTLCFLVRGNPPGEILLGFKKAGFGAGKYNGFGGKVEPGETVKSAAVREVEEEVGIKVSERELQPVARLTFLFSANPTWDRVAHVFIVTRWDGDPVESAEMKPTWFRVHEIPFDRMWQGDIHWVPRILAGERIQGHFTFGEDGEVVTAWNVEAWDGDHVA